MLQATSEKAEHLRLTGGPAQASGAAVRQYNALVERLKDILPGALFSPLEEDASFVDLGMCCEQLAAYLEGIAEAEKPTAGKKVGMPEIHGPIISIGKTGDIKDLGEMIRQAMPSWLREQMEKKGPEQEKPEADMNDLESRIAELGAQMQVLAERMHREELSSNEIRELADQMRELGQQQSELAKQHAAIRAHKDADEAAEQSAEG